jgi:hypothetical protein
MQLSKNFQLNEFTSVAVSPAIELNLILLARQLQALRDYFGTPVKIITGISSENEAHASGKAAVFYISGKSGEQIKAALENLIKQGAVFNGTIGLMSNNKVYYSLSPQGERWNKTYNIPTGETGQNTTIPGATQTEKTGKSLTMVAMILGLIVLGSIVFKRKK